jgi:hypothetical protein
MAISTHEISLHGVAGAVFWCVMSAFVFYVLAFATVGWETTNYQWIGLWMTCTSINHVYGSFDWFHATQAMITIGLIFLIAAVFCIILYMFVHSLMISKNILLIVFTAVSFAAVLFMLIGFIIFGAKHDRGGLNWSYAFSVIGAILCLAAGILAVVQMKKSNVV